MEVSDDGMRVTDKQIEKLNKTPHYMLFDENAAEQRHELDLLIVKQIVSVHGGTVGIDRRICDGFAVKLTSPITN